MSPKMPTIAAKTEDDDTQHIQAHTDNTNRDTSMIIQIIFPSSCFAFHISFDSSLLYLEGPAVIIINWTKLRS